MSWNVELDKEFKANWHPDAFKKGMLQQISDRAPESDRMLVFANIGWNINEREVNILKEVYSIPRENIKQIKNRTFTLEFTERNIYETAIKNSFIQIGTEPVRINVPEKRESNIRPIQCFRCQKYSHYNTFCRGEKNICRYCAEDHESKNCPVADKSSKWKCSNCVADKREDINHRAGSRECKIHLEEIKAIASARTNTSQQKQPANETNAEVYITKESAEKYITKEEAEKLYTELRTETAEEYVSNDKLKSLMDGLRNSLTTYVKCINYDKNTVMETIGELELALWHERPRLLRRITPIEGGVNLLKKLTDN
jgi:hypothetical protein